MKARPTVGQQVKRPANPRSRAVGVRIYDATHARRTGAGAQPRTVSPERAVTPTEPPVAPPAPRPALTSERMQQERDAALAAASSVSMLHAEAATVARLSAAEERALLARAQAGDESAREAFVKANLGLVSQVAHYYRNVPHDATLDLDDLIAEGLIGLLRAIEQFNLATPYRFSTYATWWVRQAITRALVNTGHAIRVPVRMYERQHALLRGLIEARETEAERVARGDGPSGAFQPDGQPGPALLARLGLAIGLTPAEADEALRLSVAARDPLSLDVAHLLDASGDTFTLAETLEADDSATLLTAVEERADLALALAGQDEDTSALALMGRILARRDYYARRWGRDVARELEIVLRRALGEPTTLETLGREFGVSRERIRQLEAAGLDLLRREYLRANPGKRAPKAEKRPQKTEHGQEGGAA